MSDTVSQIKERLSVDEVIGSYIKLEKAGLNLRALCPFHKEKTPSFLVSPQRGSYYCFGCGAKGDIFSFVQAFEGLDFRGSLETLARRAGVEIQRFEHGAKKEEKDKLHEIMDLATSFFEKELQKDSRVKKYLEDRGLKDETIKSFRIGFSPKSWDSLKKYLLQKGFKEEDIVNLGLLKKTEDGKVYDRFRSRVMFPIFDLSSRVIAFSGRDFDPDRKEGETVPAKYINSPETVLFSKGYVFYGLNKAKDSIRERGFSILVEGQMDLVMSHQEGFTNTVAASGTALLDKEYKEEGVLNHLGVIKRLAPEVVLAYDSDKAGIKASARSTKIMLSLGFDVSIATTKEKGADPADLLKKDPKIWSACIESRVPAIVYFSDFLEKNSKSRLHLAELVSKKLIPFFASIPSSIIRSETARDISRKLKIDEDSILEDLAKALSEKEKSSTETYEKKEDVPKIKRQRKDSLVKRVFGLYYWLVEKSDPPYDKDSFYEKLRAVLGEDFDFYEQALSSMKQEMLFEMDDLYSFEKMKEWEVEELLVNLSEALLSEKLQKKKEEIERMDELHDEVNYKKAMEEYSDISRKIEVERHKRIAL